MVTGHTLELRNVSHRFGETIAAQDVSLRIEPGELVALLGPSGCGKTTLLRVIAGFLRQSEGDVLVDGASISHLPANRRRIGIVFQNYALFPHMSVGENIAYGLAAAHMPRDKTAAVVREMLDTVQMGAFEDRLPRELSGGQQQRVALARCLAIQPRILLLDEPFSALDKNLRLDMQIEIKRLQRESGITTILVTHDQQEALGMADRIAVLSRGVLEQFASPTDIYDKPQSLFVNTFVGAANLLDGALVRTGNGGKAVRLAGGAVVDVGSQTDLPEGARVLLSVRPEGLQPCAAGDPGAFAAVVSAVLPIGPSLICEAEMATGAPVKFVQERSDRAPDQVTGNEIFLRVSDDRPVCVFESPQT